MLTNWDAETEADLTSVASLEAKLAAADAAGVVNVELGFDDLLAGRPYEFLIAATNFLGVTTTAYATVDKLASPSPGVQFQGAATQTMVRSDPKTLKLDVALPNLTCTDMNVSSAALGFAWRAWRLEGAEWGDASPELSRAAVAEYTANPVSCRLPVDTLRAGATYMFRATVGFADTMTINTSATATVVVGAQDLVASILGGVEQAVAIGDDVELDGSESYDPDENEAEGPLAYAWTVARVLDDGGRDDATALLGAVDATSAILAFVPDTTGGWLGDTTYEFALTVSRGARSAAYAILVKVSSDRFMPRATVTDFDEGLKYNPTADTFAAIYFEATSPDPGRSCCDSAWEVEGAAACLPEDEGCLLGKAADAASPMLVQLGATRANTVYRLKLTVTDGIGSTSSTVVSLTTNGPPTSGTLAVTPYRGMALTTEFEFLLDGWSDDADDYPLTYTYGYRQQRRTKRTASGYKPEQLVPLVADQYASAWFVTTLPQAKNVNVSCVGRTFDRYLSYAEVQQPARVDELVISTEDLTELADDLLSSSLDTSDGEASLSLISNVASVLGATPKSVNGTEVEKTPEELAAETALIDNLFAATLSAASLVGTGTSAAATTQVLSTVSTLSANPEALSEDSQTGALDLLDNVVGGSAETGIDPDAAASTAAAVSSLLDASLFAAPAEGAGEDAAASKAALGGQMAGTVGALATAWSRTPSAARASRCRRRIWS